VTPLEVVKVRQQSQIPSQVPTKVSLCPQGCGTFIFNTGHGARDNILPKSRVPFFDSSGKLKDRLVERGTVKLLRTIFRKEGVSGLYAGLGATLTMGVPNTVVYFVCYDELSSRLKSTNHSSSWELAGAGATARIIASSMTAPLELIKTIQASRIGAAEQASGMFAEFQSLIKSEGFHSLVCPWTEIPETKSHWYIPHISPDISII
jgi:solute carrier family 25 protein 39/40